jgi:hypothetical protein
MCGAISGAGAVRGVAALIAFLVLSLSPAFAASAGPFAAFVKNSRAQRPVAQARAAALVAKRVSRTLRAMAVPCARDAASGFDRALTSQVRRAAPRVRDEGRKELSGPLGDALLGALRDAKKSACAGIPFSKIKDAIEESLVPIAMLVSPAGVQGVAKKLERIWSSLRESKAPPRTKGAARADQSR